MKELYLKYIDQSGEQRRVPVKGRRFTVGRHSESNLSIPDGRLSREHLVIEAMGEEFKASDIGSSNGTKLNGEDLLGPQKIGEGDVLLLGGGIELTAIFAEDGVFSDAPADTAAVSAPGDESESDESGVVSGAAAGHSGVTSAAVGSAPVKRSRYSSLLWIAPIFGVILIVFAGALVFILAGRGKTPVVRAGNDFEYSSSEEERLSPANKKEKEPEPDSKPGGNSATPPKSESDTETPSTSSSDEDTNTSIPAASETARIEQNGTAFLRRIPAGSDPRAFLTSEQAKRLAPRIKQLSGSAALAENIRSAARNAAQIRALGASKRLKPQFIAVAAIARLGNSRGDIVKTAQSIVEVYDKLDTQIGGEGSADALLLVAAFDQGAAGDFMKMRNLLQSLAADQKQHSDAQVIRTVWFLERQGKITAGEFENVVTFLAVGTITQNPKDFGVNAEALLL